MFFHLKKMLNYLPHYLDNYIYMKKIDSLNAQMVTMPEMSKMQFVASKGGVDKKATTWVIIGYFVLNLIINIARM